MKADGILWNLKQTEVSDAFLDFIIPVIDSRRGPDRSEDFIRELKESRGLPEEERAAAHRSIRQPHTAVSLRHYNLPLLSAQIAELSICSIDFQRAVLTIRHRLDLFNQLAFYTNSLFERTFEAIEDLRQRHTAIYDSRLG